MKIISIFWIYAPKIPSLYKNSRNLAVISNQNIERQPVLPDCPKFRKMSEIPFWLQKNFYKISGTKFWLKSPEIWLLPNLARKCPKFWPKLAEKWANFDFFCLKILNFSVVSIFKIGKYFWTIFRSNLWVWACRKLLKQFLKNNHSHQVY